MRKGTRLPTAAPMWITLLAVVVFAPSCAEEAVTPPPANPYAIPTNGLLAFYPFNGDGDVLDASGNENHASLLGTAEVTTFLTIGSNASDCLSLPYTIFEGRGDFTVSAWVRITTLHASADHTLISGARSGQANALYLLYKTAADRWFLAVNNVDVGFGPSATVEDKEWHHLAVVRKGSIGRLYLDDQEIGDGLTVPEAAIRVDGGGLLLGQEQDSVGNAFEADQSWAGDIDNVRIYNRALNRNEIRALARETGWGD